MARRTPDAAVATAEAELENAADVLEEEGECGGSEDGAESVALLKDPGESSTAFSRERLKSERGADTPFAAHCEAEEGAQDQEDGERWRESTGKFDDREADDVGDEDGTASISVSQHAEDQSAERAKGLGHEDRAEDCGGLRVEFAGDSVDTKDEEEKVEAVEGPTKEGGQESVSLLIV